MVFQGAMSSFNPVLQIRTHFVETLSAHDYDVDRGIERAKDLLEDLYLEPERMLESYPHELSGGMKQRVLIALSLVLDPDLLVMDEPTAALDLLMQRSIISLLHEIKEKHNLTIVFITHDLPLVADLADRLAVLYAFEFAEVGPADDILEDPAHPYTRALLNATPNLSAPLEEMRPIEGESPDPVNIPTGCSYHPRCPLADDECRSHDPDAYDAGSEHDVFCHHWEDSIENIDKAFAKSDEDQPSVPTVSELPNTEPMVSLTDVEVEFGSKNDGFFDFGDSEVVTAVDGVSLDIYENDVVVLIGESGCGKTTLGKTSVGLQRPTGGAIEYNGQDIWEAAPAAARSPTKRSAARSRSSTRIPVVRSTHTTASERSSSRHSNAGIPNSTVTTGANGFLACSSTSGSAAGRLHRPVPTPALGWRTTADRADPRDVDQSGSHPRG